MKYNLANQSEVTKAVDYLSDLVGRECLVEIKKISPKRSLSQNAYLHVIIGYFGLHFGYTLDEAKLIYKEINQSIYRYKKKGRIFWRSSADLNTEEMTRSIDTFREVSRDYGCPLPPATDKGWLMAIENEIEKSNYYLTDKRG